jgi:hypothetical protein
MAYKVWVQIERIDEAHDLYENVDEPVEVGYVTRIREARQIVKKIADQFCDEVTKEYWKREGIFPYPPVHEADRVGGA